MPNHTIAIGIHAMGGIGLKTSNIGLNIAATVLYQPIVMPNTIPHKEPMIYNGITRFKLQYICICMGYGPIGFTKLAKNELSETIGEGISFPSEVNVVASCQIIKKTKIDIAPATILFCLEDFILSIISVPCLSQVIYPQVRVML